jgi:hypothetical protein
MKNQNKKQKIEQPVESYYSRTKRKKRNLRIFRKYSVGIVLLGIVPAMFIQSSASSLKHSLNEEIGAEADTLLIEKYRELREAHRAENDKLNQYDAILSTMGVMGQEIKLAGIEFGDTIDEQVKLIGLSIGIANAESTLGAKFVHDYDNNCYNWWGIKRMRADGSSLRCFNDEKAGARTEASLLKRLYLNEGLDTPEKIVNKYVGSKWTEYHGHWLANVNKYYGIN